MAILKTKGRNRARVAARLSAKLQQQQAEQEAAEQQKKQQKQQADSKRPSAPASPQMKPAEATPIEVEEKTQQQQQPEITAQPAADASTPAAQAADAAAVPEPQPALSAEDQKAQTLLRTVSDRLGQIEFELPTLRLQLVNHLARICIARLKHRSHKLSASDATKLQLAHKTLKYNVGMLDENSMQAIFKLDSIQSDNSAIRAQRKATVKRGNAIIQESVKIRAKLTRWDRFITNDQPAQQSSSVSASQAKQEDVQMKAEAPAATAATAATAAQSPSTPAAEEAAMMEDEESVDSDEEEELEQKYPEQPKQQTKQQQQQQPSARSATAQPRAAAPAAAPAPTLTPLQKKYAHLHLPTYAGPSFHSRVHPLTGALVVAADLSGILSDDVSVSTDPATRTLTIRGVRLPSRRRSIPSHSPFGGLFGFPVQPAAAAVEPHGFFTKSISFDELDPQRRWNLGSLSAAINAQNQLEISIPRVAAQPPKVAPQTARRAPVSHLSGYDDAEDDDEADAYSHPYASYQQPRAGPRRVPYQPSYQRSPFSFGNGWW